MMSIHKLTAGDGYSYLTRQVAAYDATEMAHLGLEAYYTARGESPGTWLGAGLAGLGGIQVGDVVSEAQMRALFGEGRHPDADRIEQAVIDAGGSPQEALQASALGRPFAVYDGVNEFRAACASAYAAWNTERGLRPNAPVPDVDRAAIRTRIARGMFATAYGRPPADARELSGFVARASHPATTAVAGYDLTFSPVKSVSTLWAIGPRHIAEQVEAAHHAAVADTLAWLEQHAVFTRTGRGGIRQVDTRGVVAAAFTHRDNRSGDPDLHTHVTVSNKVQTLDGRWLAIDGRVLFKATVAASERYNTRLEAHLATRLGTCFAERPGTAPGKRPVREIVGVDPRLTARWSSRHAATEVRRTELATRFQADHGRTPTPIEALKLARQATLETRPPKHEPRTLAEQRTDWHQQALEILGSPPALTSMVTAAVGRPPGPAQQVTDAWIAEVSVAVVEAMQADRATWQTWHVRAEAERQARPADVPDPDLDATVDRIVTHTLTTRSVPLGYPDPIEEPADLRRRDGTSVYVVAGSRLFTSPAILHAEQQLVAATQRHDGRTVPQTVIDLALLESAANGVELNPGQAHLVRELARSGSRLQLAIAPAGSGKTTALRVLARAWTETGGRVLGLAPSAAAAAVLRNEIGAHTDTLAKLTHSLTTGYAPGWVRDIDHRTLVLIDEAGMAGTLDLAHTVSYVLGRGGSVRLVGDDQQLAAVAAGGVLRDIAATAGATTLTQLMRFTDPAEAATTLALRDGDPAAIAFYTDHGRVHVGDLATVTDQAYRDWAGDRAAGIDSVMLAPTRQLINDLNARARADRLTTVMRPGREVRLADGNRASTGDTILTRANRRDLPITATDWVKNGDRWTITTVHRTGTVRARHHATGHTITLPAWYLAAHTELGYAATIHTAQGITARTARTILDGTETRQLLYTALTRGSAENHLYPATASSGDPHQLTRPEAVFPPTAGDMITGILTRDGSQTSATSTRRTLTDPAILLAEAAARYHDALTHAAETTLGGDTVATLDAAAERLNPGLTDAPAYPTLRAHLALIAAAGHDPVITLTRAAHQRELDTADDPAAVLDWRLDPTGAHSIAPGPLPWLHAIPPALAEDSRWGTYLTARADLIRTLTTQVREQAAAHTPTTAPAWAAHLLDHHRLRADLAVWRAATSVPDHDRRPTGPPHPARAAARHQQQLDRDIAAALGDPSHTARHWTTAANRIDPRITADPYWPELAARLAAIHRAGINAAALLTTAANHHPLPDEQPAAALWWRISRHLAPPALTATAESPADTLQPPWAPLLADTLGPTRAERILTNPAWPTLVAAIDTAVHRGWQPDQLLHAATQLTQHDHTPTGAPTDTELTDALIWRITTLTDPDPLDRALAAPDNPPNWYPPEDPHLDQPPTEQAPRPTDRPAVPRQPGHDAATTPSGDASAQTQTARDQPPERQWHDLAQRIDPRLTTDPGWPRLAAAITHAAATGHDIATELPHLAANPPLPALHPATELHYRLLAATGTTQPTAGRPADTSDRNRDLHRQMPTARGPHPRAVHTDRSHPTGPAR